MEKRKYGGKGEKNRHKMVKKCVEMVRWKRIGRWSVYGVEERRGEVSGEVED